MKSLHRWPAQWDRWIIAALFFILYLGLAAAKPQHIFWSLDEGGKWIYIENVLRVGDPRAPLIYPGRELDPNLENTALYFFGRKGTDMYTWWPVGFPLLTLPFYRVFGWIGLYVLPALAGAACVYFTAKITDTITGGSRRASNAAAVIVGLASPVLYYSSTFWEHTLSVAFMLAALDILSRWREINGWKSFFLAGVLASISIFFRQETALLFAGVGLVFLFYNWRKAMIIAAGGVPTTMAWLAFNYLMLGNFLSPNQASAGSVSNFFMASRVGKKLIPYILFNSPIIGAFDLGGKLLALATLLAGGAVLTGVFRKARLVSSLFFAGAALICAYVVVQPQLYRSVHGFVLIAPFVLLFSWVFGTQAWKDHQPFWHMCLAGLVVFAAVFITRGWVAAGGLQWGPRYLLGIYPLLIIAGVVGGLDYLLHAGKWQKIILGVAVSLSLLVGVGFEVRGYTTEYLTMQLYQQAAQSAEALDDQIISTNCTWMPMVMPDLYWKGTIFRNKISDAWLENLKQSGRQEYLDVILPACSTEPIDLVLRDYQENPSGLKIKRVPVE